MAGGAWAARRWLCWQHDGGYHGARGLRFGGRGFGGQLLRGCAGVIGVGAPFYFLFAFDVGRFRVAGFGIGGEAVGVGIIFRLLGRLSSVATLGSTGTKTSRIALASGSGTETSRTVTRRSLGFAAWKD